MISFELHCGEKSYLICGEDVNRAVADNLKYIEIALGRISVSKWQIERDGDSYKLILEYYPDKQSKRLRSSVTSSMSLLIDDLGEMKNNNFPLGIL